MRSDAIEKLGAKSPQLLRYCNSLTVQLQIVGYVRNSEFFGEGYIVIPQSRAAEIDGIYQEKRSAFYGEAPGGHKPRKCS